MTFTRKALEPWDVEATDVQASSFMKDGIRLMQSDAVEHALISFDRALELRRRLPTNVPKHAYGLAGCWLNRAEALARLDPIHRELALHCYDQALVLLRSLPLGDDVRFSKRLAVAHQNRALLLASQNPPARDGAIAALREAVTVLDQAQDMDVAERHYLLAVVWMNLANVQASEASIVSDLAAREAAQRAILLVKEYERDYAAAAEAGLKARYILCQIGERTLSAECENRAVLANVHQTTNLVREAFCLVEGWGKKGNNQFENLKADLYRFAVRLHAKYQPDSLCGQLGHPVLAPE